LFSGTSVVRSASSGACSDTASDTSLASESLSIIGTRPAVDRVTRLLARPKPLSSRIRPMARTTLSKFSSGSPMPIMTTLVSLRWWCGTLPRCFAATQTWPMISAVLRLRLKPWVPVEQKVQASPQPTWLDTQSVPRPLSGMKTHSMALPPSIPSSHLCVPSAEGFSNRTLGGTTSAWASSLARSSLPRSVIWPKSVTCRW
jgi:hypothetical protein